MVNAILIDPRVWEFWAGFDQRLKTDKYSERERKRAREKEREGGTERERERERDRENVSQWRNGSRMNCFLKF
jgi:hypothetical protein